MTCTPSHNYIKALVRFVEQAVQHAGRPGIQQGKLIELAKAEGYTVTEARDAIRQLAFIQQVEFKSTMHGVRVCTATGKATDKPVGVK